MTALTAGVVATSRKENERRLAIHPDQLEDLDEAVRDRILIERGYGERFGVGDEELSQRVGGLCSREELLAECDVVLLPKPTVEDLNAMREGGVLCGWVHAVQDAEMAQVAIDRRLTLIAWEAMNHWAPDGSFRLHVFHQNNELAGYCSVLHAMEIGGRTGEYGPRLRAAVIGFGATGRGAVLALRALGIHEVSVLTIREAAAVAAPIHSVNLVTYERDEGGTVTIDDRGESMAEFLAGHDVIVNCVFQDPEDPLVFVHEADLPLFEPKTLFVDVSADAGMGFGWARPTSFEEPTFDLGNGITSYAVDHSPSLLWSSATWEISRALRPYLPSILEGSEGWERDETLRRAVEIRDGVVFNEKILSFQGRAAEYPHDRP